MHTNQAHQIRPRAHTHNLRISLVGSVFIPLCRSKSINRRNPPPRALSHKDLLLERGLPQPPTIPLCPFSAFRPNQAPKPKPGSGVKPRRRVQETKKQYSILPGSNPYPFPIRNAALPPLPIASTIIREGPHGVPPRPSLTSILLDSKIRFSPNPQTLHLPSLPLYPSMPLYTPPLLPNRSRASQTKK